MARRQLTLVLALVGAVLAVGAPVLALASSGASHASAELRDAGGAVVGWADFTEDATGRLHVNVHVNGISAGLHGIHIHAVGACSPTSGRRRPSQPARRHARALDPPPAPTPATCRTSRSTCRRRPPRRDERPGQPVERPDDDLRCRRQRPHHPRRAGRPGHQPDRQQRRPDRLRRHRRRLMAQPRLGRFAEPALWILVALRRGPAGAADLLRSSARSTARSARDGSSAPSPGSSGRPS